MRKKQQKHVKQNNKTRLTQKKNKTLKLYKKKQEEREEVIESLGALFLPHLGRAFPLSKPLNRW